jgi:hypothetical protein
MVISKISIPSVYDALLLISGPAAAHTQAELDNARNQMVDCLLFQPVALLWR